MTALLTTSPVDNSICSNEEMENRLAIASWYNEKYPGIFLYTEEHYHEVNVYLREGGYPFLAGIVDKELDTLTTTPGIYYRGCSKEGFLRGCFQQGGKTYYQDKGYMSSTSNMQIARNFIKKTSVLLVLYGPAYDIGEYSSFPEEKEFLWQHHTLFEVIGHSNEVPDGFWGEHISPHPLEIYHLRKT